MTKDTCKMIHSKIYYCPFTSSPCPQEKREREKSFKTKNPIPLI